MKQRRLIVGAIIVFAFFLMMIGIWIMVTPCPTTQRPWRAPMYIESVWPPATTRTMLGCYAKGFHPVSGIEVGVALNMDSIWGLEIPQSSEENLPPFPDRVSLYIDEEQVPITQRAEGGGSYFIGDSELDLAQWYFLGSDHFVPPGDHVAKVIITTRSGEILNYEWHFSKK